MEFEDEDLICFKYCYYLSYEIAEMLSQLIKRARSTKKGEGETSNEHSGHLPIQGLSCATVEGRRSFLVSGFGYKMITIPPISKFAVSRTTHIN